MIKEIILSCIFDPLPVVAIVALIAKCIRKDK